MLLCTPAWAQLAGSYTINKKGSGAKNFRSFEKAVEALETEGITSIVRFKISPGTYKENISISKITGAGRLRRIFFEGDGQGEVVLLSTGNSVSNGSALVLDGASYLNFQDITFKATGKKVSAAVHMANKASHNLFLDCKMLVDTTTLEEKVRAVQFVGLDYETGGGHGQGNRFSHCKIEGGYFGVFVLGDVAESCEQNEFIRNIIKSSFSHQIYLKYGEQCSIDENELKDIRSPDGVGIFVDHSDRTRIRKNSVYLQGRFGIQLNAENKTSSKESMLINNMIGGGYSYLGTESSAGVFISGGSRLVRVYHNSISYDGNYDPASPKPDHRPAAIRLSDASKIDLRNNILHYSGSSNLGLSLLSLNSQIDSLDHNIYYSPSSIAYFKGRLYESLNPWRTAFPSYNQSSHEYNVRFAGDYDLHLGRGESSEFGAQLGVRLDFDRENRCTVSQLIGADENHNAYKKGRALFSKPDTVFALSPVLFQNAIRPEWPMLYTWQINGQEVAKSRHLKHQFDSVGTYDVSLISEACGGSDTFTVKVEVFESSTKPNAEFIASRTQTYTFEHLKLNNLSNQGAQSWSWCILPKTKYLEEVSFSVPAFEYLDGTDSFKNEPSLRFFYPGKYSIGLIVRNAIGADTLWKKDYITVLESKSLCVLPPSTKEPEGVLYDDGGPDADYSSNRGCGFLIEPCAEKIELDLRRLVLAEGDYLRIYDGIDDQGVPLWDTNAYPNGLTGIQSGGFNTMLASSGKAFVRFVTDGKDNLEGFELAWKAKMPKSSVIVADFDIPDSVCAGLPLSIENQTKGYVNSYSWNFGVNAFSVSSDSTPVYTYNKPGSYQIRLISRGCGYADTVVKTISTYEPDSLPTAIIWTEHHNPVVGDQVKLAFDSKNCVTRWEWLLPDAKAVFESSNMRFEAYPKLKVKDTGCIEVGLVLHNAVGSDTIWDDCLLKAKSICTPFALNTTSSAALVSVILNTPDTLSQPSGLADNGYSSFVNQAAATMELGGVYGVVLSRAKNLHKVDWAVWIDWNQNALFEQSELAIIKRSHDHQELKDSIKVPYDALVGKTRMRVAVGLQIKSACEPLVLGEFEDYRLVIKADKSAPDIILKGSRNMVIERCTDFSDPGALGCDVVSGCGLKIYKASNLDTRVEGDYTIRYWTFDARGNASDTIERQVSVVAPKPISFELVGSDTILHNVGDTYKDLGIVAFSGCGTITEISSGRVDYSTVGDYWITYTLAGYDSTKYHLKRLVRVGDYAAPTWEPSPNPLVYHVYDNNFRSSDLSVSDNYYSPGEVTLTILRRPLLTKVGRTSVLFCLSDPSGNKSAPFEQEINVIDTVPPILRSAWSGKKIQYELGYKWAPPEVDFADNYWSVPSSLTFEGDFLKSIKNGRPSQLGDFQLMIRAEDGSGNTTILNIEVEVKDTEAPEVYLNGPSLIRVCQGDSFIDPYFTFFDVGDPNPYDETETNLYPKEAGLYFKTYYAFDASDNKSEVLYRTIEIVERSRCFSSVTQNQSTEEIGISAYPNPASENVQLQIQGLSVSASLGIQVFSDSGKLILNRIVDSNGTILNTEGWPSGLYVIRAIQAGKSYSTIISVQH